jgi:hypothetical protein
MVVFQKPFECGYFLQGLMETGAGVTYPLAAMASV